MYATLSAAPPEPGESLRVLHLRRTAFGPSWHQHDAFELNAIVRGEGFRWVAGERARFGPGDIVLVPPGMPHSWASDARGEGMSEAIVIFFAPDLLGDALRLPELGPARLLLEQVGAGLAFDDPGASARSALSRLPRRVGMARLLAFLEFLDGLAFAPRRALSGPAVASGADDRARALLRRALAIVNESERAPRQSDLADRLGLTPASFSRVFKRGAGLTYSAFVDARRIERSCALLQRGDLTIAQVAYAAGFDNLSNFNRRFRSAMGQPPGLYRRSFEAAMRPSASAAIPNA